MFKKILSANDNRKSRLHDRHGQMVPVDRILRNLPRCFASSIRIKLTGERAPCPWISYDATVQLEKMLAQRECNVLEFGSGMSTIWFATRAKGVTSVEHDLEWFTKVECELKSLATRYSNIEYKLAQDKTAYTTFKAEGDETFDILLVDGPWRADCLKHHMHKVSSGGIIYVDNTDADSSSGDPGEISLAIRRLRDFSKEKNGSLVRFTDFTPGSVFATEGYMLRLPEE